MNKTRNQHSPQSGEAGGRLLFRAFLTIIALACASIAMAQSNGDKLFLEGQQLQAVQTINSQQAAIKKFQAAKIAYTTTEKKTMCDNQITICNNNISSIRAAARRAADEKAKAEAEAQAAATAAEPEPERTDVELKLSETRLDFKSTPKEGYTQSVNVTCNYDDWDIEESPDWLTVYKADTKFTVEASENTTGEDRSGVITVACGSTEATVVVSQNKKSLTQKLKDKGNEKLKKIKGEDK